MAKFIPDHVYLKAKQNGISRSLVQSRIRICNWSEERACTEPVRVQYPPGKISEEDYQIALANGISRKNLRQRYHDYGWEMEKARTEPIENTTRWKGKRLNPGR